MTATLIECIEAHRLVRAIHGRPGGGAGCCWHIVIDDGNVQNSFVHDHFLDRSHPECVALLPLLLKMSLTQRLKLGRGGYEAATEARHER